jgi:hypothetical protein
MIALIVFIKSREVIQVAGCSTAQLAGSTAEEQVVTRQEMSLFEKKGNIESIEYLMYGIEEGSWKHDFGVNYLLLAYLTSFDLLEFSIDHAERKSPFFVYLQPVVVESRA